MADTVASVPSAIEPDRYLEAANGRLTARRLISKCRDATARSRMTDSAWRNSSHGAVAAMHIFFLSAFDDIPDSRAENASSEETGANELMIFSDVSDPAKRLKSMEITAQAMS